MSFNRQSLILLGILLSSSLGATNSPNGSDPTKCNALLTTPAEKTKATSDFTVRESPRVPQEAEKYRAYVKELTEPNGILEKLGIKMTGQIVEFLQPRDLNALTSGTAGGYPVAHYLDGAAVLQSLNPKGGFALEVVYPGPEYQHGFYRDDNPESQQLSIIDHVVGHNHFAMNSGLEHYRVGQGLRATRQLDRLLTDLYTGFNKDYVQRFYLQALSLIPLVDWYTPHFESASSFEPKVNVTNYDPLGRTPTQIQRHPVSVTENVLPAFAGNMSPHEPAWKRQILEHMIVAMSFRPALVHTQIMNEGWASIMQEILPSHSKTHHNFAYWFDAARVMQTEKNPNLSDPYSLGVACWRRIRERYEASPTARALKSRVEIDNGFIAHGTEIINTMTDEQFLRFALDQQMVDRLKLAVIRKAEDHEEDPNLPPPPPSKEPLAQWIVLSRDADRVVNSIIDNVLKRKYFFNPRVKLVDFNRPNSGEVELVLDDEASRAFPLKTDTVAPTLYNLAQLIGKSVSLEATLLAPGEVKIEDWIWNLPDFWREEILKNREAQEQPTRARITVSTNGEVRVYRVTSERAPAQTFVYDRNRILTEELDENLTQVHSGKLKDFIEDLLLEDQKEYKRVIEGSSSLRLWARETVNRLIESSPYDGIVSQSPNSAGAIAELKTMLDRRLAAAMLRAMNKKGGFVGTPSGGMRIRALPSVVELEFDQQFIQKLKKETPVGPVGHARKAMTLNRTHERFESNPFGEDQGGDGRVVGPLDGNPGDRKWGPADPNGSGGKPRQPGEDPNDLSWVEIPADLYSKFLNEKVKLPILNRKPGQSRVMATKPGGRVARPQGQMLPTEIMENALKRGIGKLDGEGRDPLNNLDEAFAEGFDLLQPRDWIVKSRRPTRKPDVKVVVTFLLDASGSTAHYYESFKRFVNDVEALIRANYQGFDFRYIVFDTQAHVMKSRQEFFRAQLGGGTMYSVGLDKMNKLLEDNYPRAQWDRYAFLLGDMEDFSPEEALQKVHKFLENGEYFGVVAGLYSDPEQVKLMTMLLNEANSNEAVGVTILDQDGGYRLKNLKEVLRNPPD